MFTLKIKFPDVSNFSSRDIFEECGRLGKAGWTIVHHSTRLNDGRVEQTIEREIRELYLVEIHWNRQCFLGLEPTEIGVVFENSLLPLPPAWSQSGGRKRFLDTFGKWKRFERNQFPGFRYDIFADSGKKTLEVRVSDGQQLGRENWKKFFQTLNSIFVVAKTARHLHQFRMAAGKQNVPEMDRHHDEILETIGDYLLW